MKKAINLLRGWPSTSLLPAAALRTASHAALSDPAIWTAGLEYGPDPGYQPLREALAVWLSRFYEPVIPPSKHSPPAAADRITITGGASQNLSCLLQSFTDPAHTQTIWVVAPCYFLATPVFSDAGFAGRLRAVPEDAEGVDVAYLAREMAAATTPPPSSSSSSGLSSSSKDPGPHRKYYRHVIYCVPTFANPSGRTMTQSRRADLVALARRHDALVIADDVYDMLHWRTTTTSGGPEEKTTAILPRLVDLDIALGPSPHDPPGKTFGHAVSNGSFSKLVGPGLRTGWTYSTADFALGLAQTGSTRSGGAASQFAATVVCELLVKSAAGEEKGGEDGEEESVLDRHVRGTLRPSYARRHALIVRTIHEVLTPIGVCLQEGSLSGRDDVYGGFFVWLALPRPGPTAAAVAERCRAEENLMIGNGELFAVRGDDEDGALRFDDAIRLCFTWEDEENVVEGVERLGRVIKKMLEEHPEDWEMVGKGYDAERAK